MNWFEKIQRYYNDGYYTIEQVARFVKATKITEEQYKIITGKDYEIAGSKYEL
ncbi:XkdX family protein [Clostridium botulinum]|nr:XkdX family protein [Clostridium botulinum]NFO40921.1 XkdX family protein [Clostridium botulinum]